ncbi:MAG: hypothetical protein AABN34_24490 [Acidobacteriota bacterium]
MDEKQFDPENVPTETLNLILRRLVLKYGGLSCAPNLANAFPNITNTQMQMILECLVKKGILRRVNDEDPELAGLTRVPEQTVYAMRK